MIDSSDEKENFDPMAKHSDSDNEVDVVRNSKEILKGSGMKMN